MWRDALPNLDLSAHLWFAVLILRQDRDMFTL